MLFQRSRRTERLRHVVVTTFNDRGYEVYGKTCIRSFLKHWPDDVELWVYAENVVVAETDSRLKVFEQTAALPRLMEFRGLFRDQPYAKGVDPRGIDPNYNFRWDAVRFSNKVFAVTDAIRRACGVADQLIWLDADTVTHRDIPHALLDGVAAKDKELAAYLNRRGYPECGWVGYNLNHGKIREFADRFETIYLTGGFLRLKENHDSFVFWKIIQAMERTREAKFKRLGNRWTKGHVFINSVLGGYMDHLKGDRKAEGKSRKTDLTWRRRESWWNA